MAACLSASVGGVKDTLYVLYRTEWLHVVTHHVECYTHGTEKGVLISEVSYRTARNREFVLSLFSMADKNYY